MSQERALQIASPLAASWWDFWGISCWCCHPGATWQLGAAVEGSVWRGKLVISEHQQTVGAGKEAAGGGAPDNYSPEPARARGADCFLLAIMARGMTR